MEKPRYDPTAPDPVSRLPKDHIFRVQESDRDFTYEVSLVKLTKKWFGRKNHETVVSRSYSAARYKPRYTTSPSRSPEEDIRAAMNYLLHSHEKAEYDKFVSEKLVGYYPPKSI